MSIIDIWPRHYTSKALLPECKMPNAVAQQQFSRNLSNWITSIMYDNYVQHTFDESKALENLEAKSAAQVNDCEI